MNLLMRLSLAKRVTLGFALVLMLLASITWMSLSRIDALSGTLDQVAFQGTDRARALMAMERAANRFNFVLSRFGASDLDRADAMMEALRQASTDYDGTVAAVAELLPAQDEPKARMAAVAEAAAAMREVVTQVENELAGNSGNTPLFYGIRKATTGDDAARWSSRQEAWQQALAALAEWDGQNSRGLTVATRDGAKASRAGLIAAAMLALALGGAVALWVSRDLRSGLNQVTQSMRRMAAHDLSVPVATKRQDELGELMRSLEDTRQSMHTLAAQVRETSQGIAAASGQITEGSRALSERTDATAATLQRTVGATHQLVNMLDQTVRTASTAGSLAHDAQTVANQGGGVVAQAVHTMEDISGASRRIADILSIIDGIAFQTNILALNAAVEAARAGDQGRGFAVVAGEVRSLAQRSATAAREIKSLIQASLEKVGAGSAQVQQAGSTASEIMKSVERVSQLVVTLADEAGQQRAGIGQASESMAELESIANHNSALAAQSTAAAVTLLGHAQHLSALVARFQLEGVQPEHPPQNGRAGAIAKDAEAASQTVAEIA